MVAVSAPVIVGAVPAVPAVPSPFLWPKGKRTEGAVNWSGAVVFVGLEFLMVARVAVSPRTIFISFSLSVRSCVTSSWSFLNCGLVVSATERAVLAETCPFKVSMSW